MDFYGIWPFFFCMGVLILIASLPIFVIADEAPSGSKQRCNSLDGLRGFLVLFVFFQHAAIYHVFLLSGIWQDPPRFYYLLGQIGVSLFFMITGYLFWGKLIRESGRINWISLYLGRVFRIGPVYYLAVGTMILIVFWRTGFHLNASMSTVLEQVIRWSPIGINGGGPDINGYTGTSLLLFGVTWTLSSEWKFYLSLVPLAFIANRPQAHLPFITIFLALCLGYAIMWPQPNQAAPSIRASLFLLGMACASLEQRKLVISLPEHVQSILVLLLLLLLFYGFTSAFASGPVILLGLIFYLIVSGASLFGLLSARPCRRLGDVSYSMYLLQGIVVTILFSEAKVKSYALTSPLHHWVAMLVAATLLFCVSTITFYYIERGGVNLGKRLAKLCYTDPRSGALNRAGGEASTLPALGQQSNHGSKETLTRSI